MLEQKQWFLRRRTQLYWGSKEMQSSFSKFKGSIFAIIFGLIIGSLIITATGNSFVTYFQYVFFFAFSSYGFNNWDNTLVWWTVYIVAGLALVVSFKAGMFNIGVSGQMLASAAVIIAIGVRYNLSQGEMLVFTFVGSVLASMLVAGIIVLLKVLFNVNEVVSSILLNWAVWYFIKWIFTTSKDLYNQSQGSTSAVHDSLNLTIGGYNFIIPVILAFVLVIGVWFLLKKTTMGYKFKTLGMNPFAADYAGISRKKYGVSAFMISGALAGVMAFLYYVGFNPSLSFSDDNLPSLGSDCISVALVGQINAFGVVGAALLWGVIKSGGAIGSSGLNIPNSLGDIIFGVIIYSAAIAVLLSKLKPIKFLVCYFNLLFRKNKRKQSNFYVKEMWTKYLSKFRIKKEYNKRISKVKKLMNKVGKSNIVQLEQYKVEIAQLVSDRNDALQLISSQIYQNYKEFNNYSQKEYYKIWNLGALGFYNGAIEEKKHLYGESLNSFIKHKIGEEKQIYKLKMELKTLKKSKASSQEINAFKNKYKNSKLEIKKGLQEQFLKLTQEEQKLITKINNSWKTKKVSYKKQVVTNKINYEKQRKKVKETYDQKIAKLSTSHKKKQQLKKEEIVALKTLKINYKKEKLLLLEGGAK